MAYCENPNKSPDFTSLMAGVSLMAIIASLSAPAFADDADTKAEIRALKEQLRRLERRLEAQEQGRKRGAAANGANAVVVKGEEPPAEGDARFWWRDVAITPDGFFEFGLQPWDIAAGDLLIREAGGLVGDFAGGHDYLDSGHVVTGNPKLFKALLTTLTPHMDAALRK